MSDISQNIESVLVSGDLANLTPVQRVQYYNKVCESLGLNPLTRPFDYIKLNGKLTLYARKDASDQLRKINKVSIKISDSKIEHGIFMVTVEASIGDRVDTDLGAVALHGLKGEALSNAMMKTITKAKRRVTLSICGLGFSDETEVTDIPGAEVVKLDANQTLNAPLAVESTALPSKPKEKLQPVKTQASAPQVTPIKPVASNTKSDVLQQKIDTLLNKDFLNFEDDMQ